MAGEFGRVGVVGLGTMGAGIAEVLARAGLAVVGVESDPEALERGRGHLQRSTDRAVARGRLAAGGQRALLARVELTTDRGRLADAELVVEAVPERLELKRSLFADLDRICGPATILATNTSSLSVTAIAAATGRPERVVGMHWFNPAPAMQLVEIVRTVVSDPAAVAAVQRLVVQVDKVAVTVGDRAGFIANALLFGYLNAAIRLYAAGFVGRADLDTAMTLGAALPMGPLALLDLIGLDTAEQILATMYDQSRDPLHAPAPLLTQLVSAGRLGRKSGRGFHDHTAPPGGDEPVSSHPAGIPRPVERVGVVGAGPADGTDMAAALTAGGYEVIAPIAADPTEAERQALAGCGFLLVLDAAGAQERGEDGRFGPAARLRPVVDRALAAGAVVATGTDGPVVGWAACTGRPEQVVGLRWHPAAAGGLVEVAAALTSHPDAVATAVAVCVRAGRRPVVCGDGPGRVVAALLVPYLNDAVRMVAAGYATADEVDTAMRLGCGYPAGPFAMLDDIGLDVALATQQAIYRETREPGLAPAPLLQQLVLAGRWGRRVGRGFREHGVA